MTFIVLNYDQPCILFVIFIRFVVVYDVLTVVLLILFFSCECSLLFMQCIVLIV